MDLSLTQRQRIISFLKWGWIILLSLSIVISPLITDPGNLPIGWEVPKVNAWQGFGGFTLIVLTAYIAVVPSAVWIKFEKFLRKHWLVISVVLLALFIPLLTQPDLTELKLFGSEFRRQGLITLSLLGTIGIAFFIFADRVKRDIVIGALWASGLVQLFIGFLQIYGIWQSLFADSPLGYVQGVVGTFNQPNFFTGKLLVAIAAAFYLSYIFFKKKSWLKWISTIFIISIPWLVFMVFQADSTWAQVVILLLTLNAFSLLVWYLIKHFNKNMFAKTSLFFKWDNFSKIVVMLPRLLLLLAPIPLVVLYQLDLIFLDHRMFIAQQTIISIIPQEIIQPIGSFVNNWVLIFGQAPLDLYLGDRLQSSYYLLYGIVFTLIFGLVCWGIVRLINSREYIQNKLEVIFKKFSWLKVSGLLASSVMTVLALTILWDGAVINLLFGYGFDVLADWLNINELNRGGFIDRAHNFTIDILFTTGVVGLTLALWALYKIYKLVLESGYTINLLLLLILDVLLLRMLVHTNSIINIVDVVVVLAVLVSAITQQGGYQYESSFLDEE